MRFWLMNLFLTGIFIVSQTGCTFKDNLELKTGEYFFEKGYYKRAMSNLLPPAHDGDPKAQYAVGYMYYYGYGVQQDTDRGYYWIEKAARCNDPKAIEAMHLLTVESVAPKRTYTRYLRQK